MKIEKINFDKTIAKNSFFDFVDLETIFKMRPQNHSQYEHHGLSFYVILVIAKGNGKHNINFQDYSYQKGTVFNLRKGSIHKFYKTNAKGSLLVFTEDFVIRNADREEKLELLKLFNEMLDSPKMQLNSDEFVELESLLLTIEKEFSAPKDNFSIGIIRSMIQIVILLLLRIKSKSYQLKPHTRSYKQFISLQESVEQECFTNKKVSYYADKMGVTTKTLNRITQDVIGKNAKPFIDEIVIFKIKGLLINTQLSYSEIAYQAGFSDPTNFFKFFRKRTELSPKEFKEHLK